MLMKFLKLGELFSDPQYTLFDSDNKKEITYKIVGNLESDPEQGHDIN